MSVRERNGTWIIEIYDPSTKKKRHVRQREISALGLPLPTSRRQAERIERKILDAYDDGTQGEDTCARFAERWTTDYPRPDASSNKTNHERVSKFGKDFGDRLLRSVTRREAREWATENKGRAPHVRTMFNDAVNDGILNANVFANLRLNTGESTKERGKRRSPVTVEELDRLADTALEVHGEIHGPVVRAMILVAAYTGLRAGELFALRWSWIDGDLLHVQGQFSSALGREKTPKKGSTGTIYLPEKARAALATIPRRIGDDLVFRTKRGKQYRQGSLGTDWHPVRDTFGRHDLVFHTLRHFCATHLLNELRVEPWKVSKQLRHSDGGGLVLRTYGHPSDDVAIADIRRAFGGNVKPLKSVSGEDVGRTAEGSA